MFLLTPNDDTTCSLSPTATNKNPIFVFKNKSKIIFITTTIAKIINIELIKGFLKIWLVLNNGIFDFPIILKFTEYNPIITNIPDIKLLIFNFTCKKPVIAPAQAPPNVATNIVTHGFTPWTNIAAEIDAPSGNVPSTERSGKSNILYVI